MLGIFRSVRDLLPCVAGVSEKTKHARERNCERVRKIRSTGREGWSERMKRLHSIAEILPNAPKHVVLPSGANCQMRTNNNEFPVNWKVPIMNFTENCDMASDNSGVCLCSLKRNEVCGKMEIPKLHQTEGRNVLCCKNVQLSGSKVTAVSEEKTDK